MSLGIGRWGAMLGLVGAAAACASGKAGSAGVSADARRATSHRFVDADTGFAIDRPDGEAWQFISGGVAPEGLVVPVIIVHEGSGAQVVVQVAPGIASSEEFAERLAMGLQSKPGFEIEEPRAMSDGGTAFEFTLSNLVEGRVRVHEGSGDRIIVLLGTWPRDAPAEVVADVERIMASMTPFAGEGRTVTPAIAPGDP